MRMAPRGEVGWRLCPAKLDRQPVLFAHALLTVRETSAAPCLRDRNHTTRTSTWARLECAFRRLLSSSSKPHCPSIVYSLPISAQSYAFIQILSIYYTHGSLILKLPSKSLKFSSKNWKFSH